jgi:outer membrane protein W
MRKSIVVAVSLLFVAGSAFSQQPERSNSVSVFVSDLGVFHSSNGTSVDAAFGAAFGHMFNRHVGAELSVTNRPTQHYVAYFINGQPVNEFSYTSRLLPIDALVSYHFLTDSRWKPYLGAGARYLSSSIRQTTPLGSYRSTTRSVDPEVSGGVIFQFRPALGLRFDAKQVLGSRDYARGDSAFSGSVGLSFRF